MDIDRALSAASNAVCIILGVALGLALSTFSDVSGWLEKWQTLIAGALALLAGTLSVLAMRRSDELQERRHSQLIGFSQRSEFRKLERALRDAEITTGNLQKAVPDTVYDLRQLKFGAPVDDELAINLSLSLSCAKFVLESEHLQDVREIIPISTLKAQDGVRYMAKLLRTHPEVAKSAADLPAKAETTAKFLESFHKEWGKFASLLDEHVRDKNSLS
ncbi:hypothetical protein [Chelativorans sp. YIM 93263]|uniref:hypothetical protein n=1 Tax=Chelativorans sp. YIM 93263 TaxID=2906648 RepID=UPI002378263E|nr:hypothetical protein [Chelativorans sp. YIM 93263]